MAITITPEHTRTFGELKKWVLAEASVSDHFAFRDLGSNYINYWDGLNREEFERGYVPGEYEKPGSPGLHEMKLLTQKEFNDRQGTFRFFHKR